MEESMKKVAQGMLKESEGKVLTMSGKVDLIMERPVAIGDHLCLDGELRELLLEIDQEEALQKQLKQVLED